MNTCRASVGTVSGAGVVVVVVVVADVVTSIGATVAGRARVSVS